MKIKIISIYLLLLPVPMNNFMNPLIKLRNHAKVTKKFPIFNLKLPYFQITNLSLWMK